MEKDVIVIGGGQSALACAYYLRRAQLDFLIVDKQDEPGGAWLDGWDSLTLFSPAEHSSLPGWMMPKSVNNFPTRKEVVSYLENYEKRYEFPVQRGVTVTQVNQTPKGFKIDTTHGVYMAKTVISATGTLGKPFVPTYPGLEQFNGIQLHSAAYRKPDIFHGQRVLVVGEGNSGAQLLAELSLVATCYWSTRNHPEFLPDDVDGRVLFDRASAIYYAKKQGKELDLNTLHLGNIVMTPPVKAARERGALVSSGRLESFNQDGVFWDSGDFTPIDIVIWCTGFGYATDHLANIVTRDERGKCPTNGTASTEAKGLFLVGYGGWTGFASATLIGVGRSAKSTVDAIKELITSPNRS